MNLPSRLLTALAALASLAGAALAQAPEARFAFVIGNDSYEGAPLKTSANDAGLIAESLKQTGFDVTGARNLDQDTLRASYREFLEKVAAAGPGAVAGVYLSGYGLQSDGENYFVPVGAKAQTEADLALNAIRVSDLTRALAATPAKARFMALDIAYDGPFAKQGKPLPPGLAIVDADAGSLIAFNAAPGLWAPKPAGNYGDYARALSEALHIPGLPLAEIFARARTLAAQSSKGALTPWDASKLDPAFALTQPAPASAGVDANPVGQIEAARKKPLRDYSDADAYAAALDRDSIAAYEEFLAAYPKSPFAKNARGLLAARREALTWRRTANANNAQSYWTYLRRYAHGPHAGEARRRLDRLAAAETPPAGFSPVDFDIAPPPEDEDYYFADSGPRFYDPGGPAPVVVTYMPPAPDWWSPPPPPAYAEDMDEVYFLPEPAAPPPPPWWALPGYVVTTHQRFDYDRDHRERARIAPYIAIPAALAAGIVAGKLISNRVERRNLGVQGFGPRPSVAVKPGAVPGRGGNPPVSKPFLPPIGATPQAVNRFGLGAQPAPGAGKAVLPGQKAPAPGGTNQLNLKSTLPGAGQVLAPGQAGGRRDVLPGQPAGQPTGQLPGKTGGARQPGVTGPATGDPQAFQQRQQEQAKQRQLQIQQQQEQSRAKQRDFQQQQDAARKSQQQNQQILQQRQQQEQARRQQIQQQQQQSQQKLQQQQQIQQKQQIQQQQQDQARQRQNDAARQQQQLQIQQQQQQRQIQIQQQQIQQQRQQQIQQQQQRQAPPPQKCGVPGLPACPR